jgi:hypothetical protein
LKLRRDAIKTRGVVLARAVPQTSDAKNRIARTRLLARVIASKAKQSSAAVPPSGLLRRFAARNDESKFENPNAEEKLA